MKHIVIDFEMCTVPKSVSRKTYKPRCEIIQIGAAMLDEKFNQIGTFSTYVKPEYGQITNIIFELTGISSKNLVNAPLLKDALKSLQTWIGDEEFDVYTWSNSDWIQLKKEVTFKNMETPDINQLLYETEWIDYQKCFGMRFEYDRQVSLLDALALTHTFLEGKQHDGLDDAINTGRLIYVLESDPEYELPECYHVGSEDESEGFGINLGNLLQGLDISA